MSVASVVPLRPATARLLRRVGLLWLLTVVLAFTVLTFAVGLPADPEGDTLVSAVQTPLQLTLLGLAALGGLLALRLPAVGATALAFAAAGLGLVAAVEYERAITLGVTFVFAVPAVLLWLSWQHLRSRRAIVVLALVAALILAGEAVAADRLYNHFFGPAHPESKQVALPVDAVEWVWSGVGAREATVVARVVKGASRAGLVLDGPEGATLRVPAVEVGPDRVVRLAATGLSPGAAYGYTVEVDGDLDGTRGRGRFTTFPEGASSFTVAVGSCARTGSNGAVFDAIADANPLLYVIAGDVHYENLTSTDPASFLRAYDRVLTAPAQAALYRSVPVAYMYDDHDYGPNDADATAPSRAAARAAYQQAVPHAPLPAGPGGPVYQAFTVGRVRFVMTDTRSERSRDTTLGAAQRDWLLGELRAADRYGLVVWVNPDPWVGTARDGADNWAGFPEERRLIADTIAAEGIRNLVMLSGDAHMVGIDDGTNTDYATAGGGGFPLLHAGALDRPGNVKGGPYSEGAYPGPGQFGLLRVSDDGDSVEVELSGRTWDGRELVKYAFRVPGV